MADFVLDTKILDEMIAKDPQRFADVVGKTANRILTDARVITPRDPARPPEHPEAYSPSGELRANSDVVKQDALGLTQTIEYYQEYAAPQELGFVAANGRFVGPRPFLTPSVEKQAEQFVKDIAKAMENG